MYELVIAPENRDYGKKDGVETNDAEKAVIFRNASVEHVAVIAYDTETGVSVNVLLRKDSIPKWINTEGRD